MGDLEKSNNSSWDFSDEPLEKYNADQFYTRATGAFGHKELLRVPFPPEIVGRLSELIARRAIPKYRTVQDLIRDAVVHRLVYLNQRLKDDELAFMLSQAIHLEELEKYQQDIKSNTDYVAGLKELLENVKREHDELALRDVLEEAELNAANMREPYKTKVLNLIVINR